jgi:hypothetical protein
LNEKLKCNNQTVIEDEKTDNEKGEVWSHKVAYDAISDTSKLKLSTDKIVEVILFEFANYEQ